jgi:hypothetical protein
MDSPCFIFSLGVLICTAYNALDLMKDHSITNDIFDLELRKIIGSEVEGYDIEQWPELRRLWIGEKFYRCKDGYCYQDLNEGKYNDDDQDSNDNQNNDDDNDNQNNDDDDNDNVILTDVGVILMCAISILFVILIGLLTRYLCKKTHARRCFRNLRRHFRGGVTLNGDTIEEHEMSYTSPDSGARSKQLDMSPIDQGTVKRSNKNLDSTRNSVYSSPQLPPPKDNVLNVDVHNTNLKEVENSIETVVNLLKKDDSKKMNLMNSKKMNLMKDDDNDDSKKNIAEGGDDSIAEGGDDSKMMNLMKDDDNDDSKKNVAEGDDNNDLKSPQKCLLGRPNAPLTPPDSLLGQSNVPLMFHPVDIRIKGALGLVQTSETTMYGVHCIDLEPHGRKYPLDEYPDPETIMERMNPVRSITNYGFKDNDDEDNKL